TIQELRSLEFPLKTIKEILEHGKDDAEIVNYLEQKSAEFEEQINRYEQLQRRLQFIINHEETAKPAETSADIIIKNIPEMKIASIRFVGDYSEIGDAITNLMRSCGRQIGGPPFSLYYDGGYRAEDVDIEVCVPIHHIVQDDGIKTRVLPGGKALSILHPGPYETVGSSYKKIIDYLNAEEFHPKVPPREIYLKGPGMILPRSPKRYITEIQMLIDEEGPSG
ncbi:MAG TPA: MerR family transcriptional regulator, partial [Bacillota bacterium]|nr:MerR family transcriptional regulator [Bacillota bacterium]